MLNTLPDQFFFLIFSVRQQMFNGGNEQLYLNKIDYESSISVFFALVATKYLQNNIVYPLKLEELENLGLQDLGTMVNKHI